MLKEYPHYGLQQGEEMTVTRGSGFHAVPSRLEVVQEYPTYILLQCFFFGWDGKTHSYRKGFHKGSLLSGDTVIRRKGGIPL